jgi:DNA-binding transcriptional MerR regulator
MRKYHMTPDVTASHFTNGQVCDVAGISPATLQNWANRGIVRPLEERPGTGQKRLYSGLDVVRLALMAELVNLGVAPGTAAEMCAKLGANQPVSDFLLRFVSRYTYPDNKCWFLIHRKADRYDITIISDDSVRLQDEILKGPGACIVIDAGVLIANTITQLEGLLRVTT